MVDLVGVLGGKVQMLVRGFGLSVCLSACLFNFRVRGRKRQEYLDLGGCERGC